MAVLMMRRVESVVSRGIELQTGKTIAYTEKTRKLGVGRHLWKTIARTDYIVIHQRVYSFIRNSS